MAGTPNIGRLDTEPVTLVFDLRRGFAELVYLGGRLPADEALDTLCDVARRAAHENAPDQPVPASILPLGHTGYLGVPTVELLRGGKSVTLQPQPVELRTPRVVGSNRELVFGMTDSIAGVSIESRWQVRDSGVIAIDQRLTLDSGEPATLLRAASMVLPVPRWVSHLSHHRGRWSAEMHTIRSMIAETPRVGGSSRGGRSGFSAGQWLVLESAAGEESRIGAIGVHLAWSGDHTWQLDTDADGQSILWLGAHLEAGEVTLSVGETFEMPQVLLAPARDGRGSLRRLLHRHVRAEVLPPPSRNAPRKVHLNTWEACGFHLSMPKLESLAGQAADLGVERFVLDDGWFGGRRDDRSSLGDWEPSPKIFPQGLAPFIERIHALGMDFGLWVEPEMVSPDSLLYAAHPDWCIHVDGIPRSTQRHQLVLDLSRSEVATHIFDTLDNLLRRHRIAYLKWDHNRELFPTGLRGVSQTRALYRLLDRLREAHPTVEIESCASGGGRVDYAIMSRCARFWPSDNNDALERLRINAAWMQYMPLCSLGNHVGPSPNPVTGRHLSMGFRAKVAMFGHMGVEADLTSMSEDDRRALARHIDLYKTWRDVLHAGEVYDIASTDSAVSGALVVHGSRALGLVTREDFARDFEAAPVRFEGLEPARRYRVSLPEPWPEWAARYLATPERWRSGVLMSGRALADGGLALPLRHPATAWLVALEAV